MPTMTNSAAIDFMRKHVNAVEVTCPEAHKHVLHLAECWENLSMWAKQGAPAYSIKSEDLLRKMNALEFPRPPDSKAELREALDELYNLFLSFWFSEAVETKPILDKITELRKRAQL